MNTKSLKGLGLSLAIILAVASCKKDDVEDPEVPNEQELITTVELRLTPSGGGDTILLSYEDLDGDGPDAPVVTMSDNLASNTEYNSELLLLNRTEMPADSINAEILEEAEEHQFFFAPQVADMEVMYADMDADGNPIGLSTVIETGEASEGVLNIILRHEPAKDGAGVSEGDITNAGGETDIESNLNVVIQ